MTKSFLIDLSKCYGCQNCVIACRDEYVDNDWSPYAVPQPDVGHKWMNVLYLERGAYPKVKMAWTPTPCMQCGDAPCMKAATGGAVYRRSDGIVIIDPVKAVGQKQIVSACPYGAVYWNDALNVPQKCIMCAHILDNSQIDGGLQTPRCVMACPLDAITFGEYSDLKPSIDTSGAAPLHPEYGTKPNVFYIGLPKRFITGCLVNSTTHEYVKDALVTATDLTTGSSYTATTDIFGDFWLDGLEANRVFQVKVSKAGMFPKTLVAYTSADKDLGDIQMVGA